MKKAYVNPKAEKLEFDYSETVTASDGHLYLLYTDQSGSDCHTKESDPQVWVTGELDISCKWEP